MPNKTHLTTVTFNAAGIVGVGSVQARAMREPSVRKPLGQDFTNCELGPLHVEGSARLYFDKSDHAAVTNHLKNRTAAQTMTIAWNTGETWSGPAKITEVDVVGDEDLYVLATVSFVADGDWTAGL